METLLELVLVVEFGLNKPTALMIATNFFDYLTVEDSLKIQDEQCLELVSKLKQKLSAILGNDTDLK